MCRRKDTWHETQKKTRLLLPNRHRSDLSLQKRVLKTFLQRGMGWGPAGDSEKKSQERRFVVNWQQKEGALVQNAPEEKRNPGISPFWGQHILSFSGDKVRQVFLNRLGTI
jgi:hypothetical protein